jgi:cAMP phosphodiesterase
MKVVILGSPGTDGVSRQYVSSYLVNGSVAIDAGCLGLCGSPQEQEAIQHVLLTHAHADHIASLPFFIENVWSDCADCPTIYGGAETLATVQRAIFNGEVWPDFVALSERMSPFLRLQVVQPEIQISAGGLTVTPVPVDHTVPTFGYIVQDGAAAVIFAGDSGPTTRLWEVAAEVSGVRAVFLEVSFPNRMRSVADASIHLTPEMFANEVSKVPPGVRIIAVHMKVRYREEIISELRALQLPCVEIGECDREYSFSSSSEDFYSGSLGRNPAVSA